MVDKLAKAIYRWGVGTRHRTKLVLFMFVFNSCWLAAFFWAVANYQECTIMEGISWLAWVEFGLVVILIALGIERFVKLRERK